MAEIVVNHVSKAFGDFVAVKDSTFKIDDGDFFVLLGPSGCGKTTTLRMIAGLELPTGGGIYLGNNDVTFERASNRDIAFVFQMFALYPHMNVRENIAFPLKCQRVSRTEIKRRVEEVASILQIEHIINLPVGGLSGGDRQRVSLGRAIVRKPQAFMMDEPLGALDTEFRHLMCTELRELHNRMDATTVYVTHDQLEAMSMADKIMVMNHGTIEQLGAPQDIYDRPNTMFVADFLGDPSMNFLTFTGKVSVGDQQLDMRGIKVDVSQVREHGGEGVFALGVRPEHVRLSDDGAMRGQVFATEYLGTTQIVTVNTEFGQLKARIPSSATVNRDDQVGLDFETDRLVVFNNETGRVLQNRVYQEASHGGS